MSRDHATEFWAEQRLLELGPVRVLPTRYRRNARLVWLSNTSHPYDVQPYGMQPSPDRELPRSSDFTRAFRAAYGISPTE